MMFKSFCGKDATSNESQRSYKHQLVTAGSKFIGPPAFVHVGHVRTPLYALRSVYVTVSIKNPEFLGCPRKI